MIRKFAVARLTKASMTITARMARFIPSSPGRSETLPVFHCPMAKGREQLFFGKIVTKKGTGSLVPLAGTSSFRSWKGPVPFFNGLLVFKRIRLGDGPQITGQQHLHGQGLLPVNE